MRPASLRASGCERVCSARLLACPPATLAAAALADAWPSCVSGKAATAAIAAAPAIQTRFIMTPFRSCLRLNKANPPVGDNCRVPSLGCGTDPVGVGESDQVCSSSGEARADIYDLVRREKLFVQRRGAHGYATCNEARRYGSV